MPTYAPGAIVPTYAPGAIVELHSLRESPELNKRFAECVEWLPSKKRYQVRLLGIPVKWASDIGDAPASELANLKPSNLKAAPKAAEERRPRTRGG